MSIRFVSCNIMTHYGLSIEDEFNLTSKDLNMKVLDL